MRDFEEKYLHQPGFIGYSRERKWETIYKLTKGAVDTHINMGQDYTGMANWGPGFALDRPFEDVEIAMRASEAGMKAVVFTSHVGPSFFRVPLIQKAVDEWAETCGVRPIKVIGSVTLNYPMGGLNPEIVRMMVRFGGKVVCVPSTDGWNMRNQRKIKGGIELVKRGKVVPELEEIIGIMAENKLVMDTSFTSPAERTVIFDHAKSAGITGSYVFNPLSRGATNEHWAELAKKGLKLAVDHHSMIYSDHAYNPMFELFKMVGIDSCVHGSDTNNWPNQHPVEATKLTIAKYLIKGLSEADVEKMFKTNPTKLLGL